MRRVRFTIRLVLVSIAMIAMCLGSYVHWRDASREFVMLTMGGSQAMEPFINGRAYLAIDMNAYRRARPARWEAVVFRLQPPSRPGRAATASILRVVGLPGETVSFSDGKVVIDGRPMEPPSYLPPHLPKVRYHVDVADRKAVPHPYTVPDGCYYLLGDNPDAASDSRLWGALPEAEILSRYPTQVEPARVWPTLGIATLMVLAVFCWFFRSWCRAKASEPVRAECKRTPSETRIPCSG